MAQFVAGNNPADHTVSEVNEYLRNADITPDEYERVVSAERAGRGRVGIISGSGAESDPFPAADPVADPAGPNEATTGQESPADRAATSADPQASGDAGLTAEQYPDKAPASLGPDMPQSDAELAAHKATLAAAEAAEAGAVLADDRPRTQTPAEAMQQAIDLNDHKRRERLGIADDTDAPAPATDNQ